MPKKINTEMFLKRVKEKFPDNTDDLSKVVYEKNNKKVIFICPKHGEYMMTPSNYLNGQRCPKCKYEKFSENKRRFKNDEDFKNEIRRNYGDKYDLSKAHYIANKYDVIIGYNNEWYKIKAGNLLKGNEPRKIAMKEMGVKKRSTLKEFIAKAIKKNMD